MRIDDTKFGSITIDGQTYPHDVYILPSGKIEKCLKKNSPRIEGYRSLGISEVEYPLSFQPDVLIIGKEQTEILPIQPEAHMLLENIGIPVIIENTPDWIPKFNSKFSENKKVVAIFHTTC